MRMPGVPAMIMRLPCPERMSMPVAVLMRVNNASCVLMRMSAYFFVRAVIRVAAHRFRYQPLLYSPFSADAFLRVINDQPLLRTLTTSLGESIDALSCR
jgi:hypothetical protein